MTEEQKARKEFEEERQAVERGAKLMDSLVPGWEDRIDVETLRMSNGSMCMLGQTFGVMKERLVAREMYPDEIADIQHELVKPESLFDRYHWNGYSFGINLFRKMARRNKISQSDLGVLSHVCNGHDNKCHWVKEILDRREAKDGANKG